MSKEPFIPAEIRALTVLREAEKPLTADEILDRLPAYVRTANSNPREWLRNHVLHRTEVGRVRRGVYVYLPAHISGSTLRVPLTGREAKDRFLRLGPDVVHALWSRSVGYYSIRSGATAACELPNGQQVSLSPEAGYRRVGHARGDELWEWLRQERSAAGDALLLYVQDAETNTSRMRLERRADRDATRITERNRQLGDMVEQLIREARQPLRSYTLVSHLLARDVFRDECPPDPFYVVLFCFDSRFTRDGLDDVALATKWDRRMEVFPARDEVALDLGPWLTAVGYGRKRRSKTDSKREQAAWDTQVYRLRVTRGSRVRTMEVRGDQTLGELDVALRFAFDHDPLDHLSEFCVPTGARRGEEGLGEIYPGGKGDGAAHRLGELGLEAGDTLQYVYDFGDWITHTVTVEAVVPVETGADYPREIARGATRRRK